MIGHSQKESKRTTRNTHPGLFHEINLHFSFASMEYALLQTFFALQREHQGPSKCSWKRMPSHTLSAQKQDNRVALCSGVASQ